MARAEASDAVRPEGVRLSARSGTRGRMTPEQQKEEISKAYLHAVAARSGFAVASWSQDHGRIDATLSAGGRLGAGAKARPKLDIQLKCTARADLVHDDHVAWTLDRTHYDDLRAESVNPHILVVLVLPAEEAAWITHSPEELTLRRYAYWASPTWRLRRSPSACPGARSSRPRRSRA